MSDFSRKMVVIIHKQLFLLVSLALVLTSCPTPRFSDNGETGSLLVIVLSAPLKAKTIIPPLEMDVASYTVSGSGPNGASFSQAGIAAAASTFSQNALAAGAWIITVDAYNALQQLIGSGSTPVTIEAKQTAQASVQVGPLSGTGTFTINISWTAGLIAAPGVSATLTPGGGAAQNLTFAVGANSASYSSGNTLSSGYYSLTLQVTDGGVGVWGFFDAVRILQGQTTTASFNLTSQDLHTGSVTVTITPSLQNPIAITFTGQQSQLPPGTDMTITATTSESPVAYQWYLNGIPLSGQTSSSITIGSSLTTGNYRLDLGVTKGNVISGENILFSVLGPPQAVIQTNGAETGTKLDIYFYGGSEFTVYNALYTIWVEDINGAFMHDLFVCNAAGTNVYPYSAAWVARPQSVPYWTHKASIEDPYGYVGNPAHNTAGMYLALPRADAMGGPPIPADLDAVTGATRRMDFELQTARKNDGISQFQVLLEIDQSYDYNLYFNSSAYNPGGQPSLVYGATINTNSGQQFYTMSLLGAGEAWGNDGMLHPTSDCTSALNIVGTVIVHVKP
jgi:hypothetical protein